MENGNKGCVKETAACVGCAHKKGFYEKFEKSLSKLLTELRIALIGRTGCGKSALGNTLLGTNKFLSISAGESVTKKMACAVGELPISKRLIKVVDTPGLMDIKRKDKEIRQEVEKAIIALSPGPHAILTVFSPNRCTKDEQKVFKELEKIFKNDTLFDFIIIVMVRKKEILNEDNVTEMDIHKFVEERTSDEFKELYKRCKNRIISVENFSSREDRNIEAERIMAKIDQLGQHYFDHAYFQIENAGKLRRLLTSCM